MIKKITFFLLTLSATTCLAYVSDLIKNDNIIDIGIKTPTEKTLTKIAKIKVEKEPEKVEISRVVLNAERNITDEKTCLMDELNHENCPNDLQKCNAEIEFTSGNSTLHHRHIETSPKCPSGTIEKNGLCYLDKNKNGKIDINDKYPVKVTGWYFNIAAKQGNPKEWKSDYNPVFGRSITERDVIGTNWALASGRDYGGAIKANLNYPVKMKFAWAGDDYHVGIATYNNNTRTGCYRLNVGNNYKCEKSIPYYGYKTFQSGTGYLSKNNLINKTGNFFIMFFRDGKHAVDGRDYVRVDFETTKKIPPFKWAIPKKPVWCPSGYTDNGNHYCYTKPISCPSGFKLSKDKTYCYNDYTYYTYSCPNDKNQYGISWEGPKITTGGDCLGNCGSYGCSCNSSTPPAHNCMRNTFQCPFDSSRPCTLLPTDNPESGNSNYAENYIYGLGNSIKHKKTVTTKMTCPIGWTLNIEKGTCEKEPEYQCSTQGFYYDKETGLCIQKETCESGVQDPDTGKCLYEANYNCPDDGYVYDEALKKCKKTPYCDRGTFNPVTNKCEEGAGGNVCPDGYTYNKARNRCEKPMNDYIEFTEHSGSLWVGRIGDNYLSGHCAMYSYDTSFKVLDKSKVEKFTLNYAKFDDYIGVLLNNKYVYVGPYDGNTLYVSGGKVVYYEDGATKKTSYCELSTSWEKHPNKDTVEDLINGINNVKVKVEVAGGGEGYASFSFTFKGKNTIQCIDNNYCDIEFSNTCPSGYTYDDSTDICYKDDPNANEDLINKVYWVEPNCPANGVLNDETDTCSYEPTCSGNDSSIFFDANNHVCVENPEITCDNGKVLITTNVPGYENACINQDSCPGDTVSKIINNTSVCTEEGIPTCPTGSTYNADTKKCEKIAVCPSGYKIQNKQCVKEYYYYSYYCPEGWEGPVDEGNDCNGNCGPWGCYCNNETPPANNCRKKVASETYTSKIIEKRPLIKHEVNGALTPEEFGVKKDYQCGKDCQYVVTKIQGKGDKICFIKKNNQIGCFTVDGCYFEGVIDNNGKAIKELQIGEFNSTKEYPYYISLPIEKRIKIAPDSEIGCYAENMQFNPNTRMCEGTSDLIKFTNGGWTMAGADANWIISDYSVKQTRNTSYPALLVSPFRLGEGGTFEGNLKVDSSSKDNDWIGLVFGYQDDNNYYYVDWDKSKDSWHPFAGFRLIQRKNGQNIILSNQAINAGGWAYNTTYTLKIKYGPKYLKLYKNGELILDYRDENFKPSEGKVGFYNYSQSNVTFSNFKVISYPKCPNGYTYNEASGQCVQTYALKPQYIKSTCKMYGHVGGIYVKNGIVSAIVDKDAKSNPLDDLYHSYGVVDYNLSYYDPKQRIDFWDSYHDGYLGFIEFLKEVKPKDSKENFKPKDPRVFDIASYGFTGVSPLGVNTYYVSVNPIGYGDMTEEKCNEIANKFGLTRVTGNNIGYPFSEISKFLTGDEIEGTTENPVCVYGTYDESTKDCINIPEGKPNVKYCLHGVLSDDQTTCIVTPRCVLRESNTFREINYDDYAYKVIYSNSNRIFQCSPWTCKDHKCAKAVCPTGYRGTLHNLYETISDDECQQQTCDAMLSYYEFCGKLGNCPSGSQYKEIENTCYKLTCPDGTTFDPETQKCIGYVCPPNTILSKDGKFCIRK